MADKAALGMIGLALCAATLFVVAIGGMVVRVTLHTGAQTGANAYGLQAIRAIEPAPLPTLARRGL